MATKAGRQAELDHFKSWLQDKKIRAEDFGSKTGIAFSTVRKWIDGETFPSSLAVAQIRRTFRDCPLVK